MTLSPDTTPTTATRSIRFQILVRSLLILSGLLLIIGFLQYVFMKEFLYSNRAIGIQSQIRSISMEDWMAFKKNVGTGIRQNPLDALRIPDSTVVFADQTGTIAGVWEEPHHGPAPRLPKQTYLEAMQHQNHRGAVHYDIIEDARGFPQLLVLQPVGQPDQPIGVVQVTTNVHSLQEVLIRQLVTYVALSLLALVGGTLAFLPVLRKTLIPLSRMVNTVEKINAGNLDQRLPLHQGQLETDRLAVAFNGMLQRLEDSFAAEKEAKEQMRRFVADASHELRTPLTSIHGFLEVLLRGAASNPEQLREALLSMHGESERLTKLVHDLLFLAKIDRAPAFQLRKEGLHRILSEMEAQLRLLAGDRQVDFAIDTQGNAMIDPDRMKQVILNLFQNAVQHTDSTSGHIEVSLKDAAYGVVLMVKDNGSGIPEEHLPHLFERFYRIDSARARTHGGSGLGLSISKSIVDIHGGRIHCTSKVGEGTTFTVWLPAEPAPG